MKNYLGTLGLQHGDSFIVLKTVTIINSSESPLYGQSKFVKDEQYTVENGCIFICRRSAFKEWEKTDGALWGHEWHRDGCVLSIQRFQKLLPNLALLS